MSKKRSLLDALKDRQNQSAKSNAALEAAGGAGQLMQVGGAAVSLAPGPGAVIGAVMTLGGMFLGNIASSFQTKRMREEIEFVADCVDKLPETWAQNGTLEEHILPAVVKHMTWRAQENHKEKVQAARTHLQKKLLDGSPSAERDTLHQHVEKFLNECTVNELVCLVGLKLALLSKADGVNKEDSYPQVPLGLYMGEEHLAKFVSVPPIETHLAMRGLEGRRYLVTYRHTSRDSRIEIQSPTGEDAHNPYWSFTTFGYRIADWLDATLPPTTTTIR